MSGATAVIDRRSPARRRSSLVWITGLASGAVLALNPATVLLLAVLFAPAVLMRVLDARDEGAAGRAVLLCDAAASIAPMIAAWRSGPPTLAATLATLTSTPIVVLPWLAASGAWLASETFGLLVYRSLTIRARLATARLDAEIDALREEWGAETKAGPAR